MEFVNSSMIKSNPVFSLSFILRINKKFVYYAIVYRNDLKHIPYVAFREFGSLDIAIEAGGTGIAECGIDQTSVRSG